MQKLVEIQIELKKYSKKTMAVVAAHDEYVLQAVKNVVNAGFANVILIGDENIIKKIADFIYFDLKDILIINCTDLKQCADIGVALVRQKIADILMKGLLDTSVLLKSVLQREIGLRTNRLISHVSVYESPNYKKLFLITDAAINIAPTFEQKLQILQNAKVVSQVLGIKIPKVAPLCALEKVNPAMPHTVDAGKMADMCSNGEIDDMIITGPMAFDVAISKEAALHKGLNSTVSGDADILLCPEIETGNVLVKALTYFGKCKYAGVVMGAKVPIIVTSRSDSPSSKYSSILLGLLISAIKGEIN